MAEKEIVLYGPDNKPIRKKALTREIAAPSITGVRSIWDNNSVASGLTPERLAAVLRNAIDGDHREYLTLAEEMEEREWHYASVLGTRKRAVTGLPVVVESASDDKEHVEHADAVRELTRRPEFGELVDDLLDGIGKGYAASEIIWDRSSREWQPKEYRWRDPRFFVFDQLSRSKLRLLDDADSFEGIELPAYKFIVHIPKLKSGIPIRGGLARLASTSYMCKAFTLTDWMAFVEVFGMPLRLGRYGNGATETDINTLINAVANIGTDAAAVLPDSMRIDFQDGKGDNGDELFLNLAEWLDRQTSKAVLGQTASTEGTPGKLGNDDSQDEVRKDILRADAKQLENSLNRDLVKPYIDLNYGLQDNYPRVMLQITEPEDLDALTNALEKLVPIGLGVEASWARDKYGIPDPQKGAELLGRQNTTTEPTDTANNRAEACPACGVAHNRAQSTDDEIDALLDDVDNEWQEQLEPIIDPVQQLANEANSYDEFVERLPELLDDMDSTELVKRLAEETFKARGLGDAQDSASVAGGRTPGATDATDKV